MINKYQRSHALKGSQTPEFNPGAVFIVTVIALTLLSWGIVRWIH